MVALFLLLCVIVFVYFLCVVNPIVVESTRQTISSLSTTAVSNAVYDVLKKNEITYNDIVKITYDDDQNVKMINLDTIQLNALAREFYRVAQIRLDEVGREGVSVPLGTFTGIPFLSGFGPDIKLRLECVGTMTSYFESSFVQSGINQTKHSLYVKLFSSVSLLLPAYKSMVESTTDVLVCECVIVGSVPSVFLGENSVLSYKPT